VKKKKLEANRSQERSPFSFPKGFTFIEIILAVAIFSILLGLSFPIINRNIKSFNFKSFVNKTYLILDYAKTASTLKNEILKASLDLDNSKIVLTEIDEEVILKEVEIPQKISLDPDKEKIAFYPDSTLQEFNIIIADGRRQAKISSKGFDGKILLDLEYEE